MGCPHAHAYTYNMDCFCLHSFTKSLIKKIFRTLWVKAKGCFSFTDSLLNLSKIN